MKQAFDAIIVGAGQAGIPMAGRLTESGWKVALVERKLLGGTCVNTGCTPTKAMISSAHAAHTVRRAAEFGVLTAGAMRVDLAQVKARKDAIVANSRNGLETWIGGMNGCTLFRGSGQFLSPLHVQVGDVTLEAPHIFLNVGARPSVPSWPGLDAVPFLTSTTLLDLESLPDHLVIIGGSYIGLEFAQMYRRFGSRVTVIERGPRLVGHEDPDVSAAVQAILEAEGIQVRLDAECIRLSLRDGSPVAHVNCSAGEPEVHGSHLLLAVGRSANTDDLGLEAAGLTADEHGYVRVDDQLRTKVPGIWALGDCNGRGAFTHTSYNDFEIVAANLLDDTSRKVSDRIPVHALFIDPPLAQVGMTETEVRASGRPCLRGLRLMTKVGRAVEKGETQGFMKVLVDAQTKEILGASILGVGGDEAVHCIVTAMYARQPSPLLVRSMHIHPTVAELIPTVFGDLHPLP